MGASLLDRGDYLTGKEYLRDIRRMDIEVKALKEKIEKMRQDAECIRSMRLSDMPKGGSGRDASDIVAELVDMQNICLDKLTGMYRERKKALDCIMHISDGEQRAVLILYYLVGKSWDDIASELCYSPRAIFKIHGNALVEFERVQ